MMIRLPQKLFDMELCALLSTSITNDVQQQQTHNHDDAAVVHL